MEKDLTPSLLYFVLKECSPSWGLRQQYIDFYDLVFVLEGGAEYIINGVAYKVRQGDAIFLPPGTRRSAETQWMRCAAFDFSLPRGQTLNLPLHFPVVGLEDIRPIFDDINYEWLQKAEGYALKCNALFMLILHRQLYGSDKWGNRHIRTIKRYITEHIGEKLTVTALADIAGINPVYCGALFKKLEGQSISDYISRMRVNKAASMLEKGECTIGEAAEQTGFSDISHFSKTFKRIMGVTPSQFCKKSGFDTEVAANV